MNPENPTSPDEIPEEVTCMPGFVQDIKSGVHFVMGCNNKFDHFSDISTFAKYLVEKYGKDTCLLCPAFHALVHSTPEPGFEGEFDDFGGGDSIKRFLEGLGNKCQRKGSGCEACQKCK